MFVAQAIYPFSYSTLSADKKSQEGQEKGSHKSSCEQKPDDGKDIEKKQQEQQQTCKRRKRSQSQQKNLENDGDAVQKDENSRNANQQKADAQETLPYLTFEAQEKIVVRETFDNGWWFGNTINNPDIKGYFPSTYVKVGVKPAPPPTPPSSSPPQDSNVIKVFDPRTEKGQDWMKKQLQQVQTGGPVKSEYYSVIKGYKMVKINQKNQNVLKGNHVKFDVATGMASVPIKDQAPTAKAVRQMGYYFDYHQWNEEKNKLPDRKSRPDIRKKKKPKLNLKFMDR